jgi:hypothetical protein
VIRVSEWAGLFALLQTSMQVSSKHPSQARLTERHLAICFSWYLASALQVVAITLATVQHAWQHINFRAVSRVFSLPLLRQAYLDLSCELIPVFKIINPGIDRG